MAAKSKRRKKPPRREGVPADRVVRFPSAKSRFKSQMKALEEVALAVDRSALGTANPEDPHVRFDIEILVRAGNAVKAIRLLLEQDHWEFAAAAVRQIFELLVNMEYLSAQGAGRNGAVDQYCKFGALQLLLAEQRTAAYDGKSGRPVDPGRLATIEALIASDFVEFQTGVKSDGTPRWATSWCRKNTRDLAELSAMSIRPDQYNLLFTSWSEQAHGAPGALVGGLLHSADKDWPQQLVVDNDHKIIEMLWITVTLVIELWRQLPHVESLEPDVALGWLKAISPRT